MMREQQTDARNEGQPEPLAAAAIESTTADTPIRVLLVVAGGFLVVAFLLDVILKIVSSARRQVRAGRGHSDWNQDVPPKWAPSRFDIAEVAALAPISPIDQSIGPRELLGKLLRDLERSEAGKAAPVTSALRPMRANGGRRGTFVPSMAHR